MEVILQFLVVIDGVVDIKVGVDLDKVFDHGCVSLVVWRNENVLLDCLKADGSCDAFILFG